MTGFDHGAPIVLGLVGVVAVAGVAAQRGSLARLSRSTGRSMLAVSQLGDPYEDVLPGWYITNTQSGTQVAGPFRTESGARQRLSILEGNVSLKRGAGSLARTYDEGRDGPGMHPISSLKKGEFFKRKPDARKVYRRGDYIPSTRTYAGLDTDDISRTLSLKGTTKVYVGFGY